LWKAPALITPRIVLCLGVSQLVCWGISYYLIGLFGETIGAELKWSPALVFGGFSAALFVMGAASPLTGRWIDRYGGRRIMVAGSLITALGCVLLAAATNVVTYYAAWAVLGIAMRFTLYDAAFAALARIGGPAARRPIAQITLLGGISSAVFWPIGSALADAFGWRGAVLAYAGFALATIPLHLAVPAARYADMPAASARVSQPPLAGGRGGILLASALYGLSVALINVLNCALSAHMINIMTGLGVGASAAVWFSTFRGIGQTFARGSEILFGRRLPPLDLNLLASLLLPMSFIIGLWSATSSVAAVIFTLFYGAGNGIATIARGTMPLVLFDPRTYGTVTGRLLAPSFFLGAAAPVTYAALMERYGAAAALHLSNAIALVALTAASVLHWKFSPDRPFAAHRPRQVG